MPTWSWSSRFQLGQYVRTSLWILPVLGLAAGALLGEAALALDDVVGIPTGWRYTATTASGVLTAIVGAMVALLGFVVTIGVLVVQQATGRLSPRYMRLWYRNPLQKTVLSLFAGTFASRSRCCAGSVRTRCPTWVSPWPGSGSRSAW
ncbi:hypothetical protein STREPTOSP366_63440 [Streptomyces variabilis]